MMTCLVCGSDDLQWVFTHMHNEDEGYEEYSCRDCKSHIEFGIKIVKRQYTGKNDVAPYEI